MKKMEKARKSTASPCFLMSSASDAALAKGLVNGRSCCGHRDAALFFYGDLPTRPRAVSPGRGTTTSGKVCRPAAQDRGGALWPTPPFFPPRIRPCSHPRPPPWARGKFSAFSLKALHVKKRKNSSTSRSFRKRLRRRVRDGELRKWRGPIRRGRHGTASHRRPMFPSTWAMVCCFVDWSSMVIQAI